MHANGSNRDHEAALACELAGGVPEVVHMNQLLAGEGRLMVRDEETAVYLQQNNLITLTYSDVASSLQSSVAYPSNPNGSTLNIAGLTNEAGNVMGLMPHPENHIFPWQHPRHHRGRRGCWGCGCLRMG